MNVPEMGEAIYGILEVEILLCSIAHFGLFLIILSIRSMGVRESSMSSVMRSTFVISDEICATKTERRIVPSMIHTLLKDYVLYAAAFPIGLVLSVGLGMIYLGYWGKQRLKTGFEQPLLQERRIMLVAGLMRRTWVAGLLIIGIGLVVFGLILLLNVSTRGILLSTWTLGFVVTCALVTLLYAVPTMLSLQRLNSRLAKQRRATLPDEELTTGPLYDFGQEKSPKRFQNIGNAAPFLQASRFRPQPKEAREE
jgi:hypothetical protein